MEYPIPGYVRYTIDDNLVVRNHHWKTCKIVKHSPQGSVRLRRYIDGKMELHNLGVKTLYVKSKVHFFRKKNGL